MSNNAIHNSAVRDGGSSAGRKPLSDGANTRLLSQITTDFGPREVLGRFFVEADKQTRARGVSLSFAPLEDLAEVNRRNRSSWHGLIPVFDPQYGVKDDDAFCILGRNNVGEVVATQAARLYSWTDTDFESEAQSLRLFYDNPDEFMSPGETCKVDVAAAKHVAGRVVYSGGGWYRPDFRGRWLSALLPRIARAYAFTRWYSDYTISIMSEGVVKGKVAERAGYTNVDWEVLLRNSPVGDHRCALIWMREDQLLSDISEFLEAVSTNRDQFSEASEHSAIVAPRKRSA